MNFWKSSKDRNRINEWKGDEDQVVLGFHFHFVVVIYWMDSDKFCWGTIVCLAILILILVYYLYLRCLIDWLNEFTFFKSNVLSIRLLLYIWIIGWWFDLWYKYIVGICKIKFLKKWTSKLVLFFGTQDRMWYIFDDDDDYNRTANTQPPKFCFFRLFGVYTFFFFWSHKWWGNEWEKKIPDNWLNNKDIFVTK